MLRPFEQGQQNYEALDFRLRGRQLAGRDGISKAANLMGTVAKGLISGVAAPAEANGGTPGQAKRLAFWVYNLKIALYADRAIVADGDLSSGHLFS
jgi:hypothetical protein